MSETIRSLYNLLGPHLSRLSSTTESFRAVATQHNGSMQGILKDVHDVFLSQNRNMSSLSYTMDSSVNEMQNTSRKIDNTNSLMNQSVALQTNILSMLQSIDKNFKNFIYNFSSSSMFGGMAGSGSAGGALVPTAGMFGEKGTGNFLKGMLGGAGVLAGGAALGGILNHFFSDSDSPSEGGSQQNNNEPQRSPTENQRFEMNKDILNREPSQFARENNRVQQALGITPQEYDVYRQSVGKIESNNNPNMGAGGSGGHYWGKYQFGTDATNDVNRRLGENNNKQQFQGNEALAERYFDAYSMMNHERLMKNERYAKLSPQEKLAVLGYAHNQGAGGASQWLQTGREGRDGFGTSGKKYYDSILGNLGSVSRQQQATPTTPRNTPENVAGINLKSPEAIQGGEAHPGTYDLIRELQNVIPGMTTTGVNDTYNRGPHSSHAKGLAFDFVVPDKSSADDMVAKIKKILAESGANGFVLNEYDPKNKTARTTGGHIHVEFKTPDDAKKFQEYVKSRQPQKVENNTTNNITNAPVNQTNLSENIVPTTNGQEERLSTINEYSVNQVSENQQTAVPVVASQEAQPSSGGTNQAAMDGRTASFFARNELSWGNRLSSYYGLRQESGTMWA